jgi:hypothetical protein
MEILVKLNSTPCFLLTFGGKLSVSSFNIWRLSIAYAIHSGFSIPQLVIANFLLNSSFLPFTISIKLLVWSYLILFNYDVKDAVGLSFIDVRYFPPKKTTKSRGMFVVIIMYFSS